MLALSTAWFARSTEPLCETIALLSSYGFEAFELNHVVHPLDLAELARCRVRHGFVITSLHNICSPDPSPLDPDDQYGDNLASLVEIERQQSCRHLRSTAETALRLGAKAVVVHAGSVPAAKDDLGYRELRLALSRGDVSRREVQSAMRLRNADRRVVGRPHIEQLVKSLSEVCVEFPGLHFGLESRYHYYSLPDIDEMEQVLVRLNAPNVGYWHDCGHAQVQENLGLCRHEDWLRRYGHQLVGVHFHGMEDAIHDHAAPAPGNMPYEMVACYVRADTTCVMELGPANDLGSVVAGFHYLTDVLDGRVGDTLEGRR